MAAAPPLIKIWVRLRGSGALPSLLMTRQSKAEQVSVSVLACAGRACAAKDDNKN